MYKRLEHPCFPQPENKQMKVWRYLDLPKFINLLMTQKLYLSRIDILSDLYEGSLTRKNFANKEIELERLRENGGKIHGPTNQKMRESFYVNCWRIDNNESEAMWKLYCPQNDGVAIQTTYENLVSSTDNEEVYIGLVNYLDYDSETFPSGNVYYPLMHKRKAFEHEKEVRLVKAKSDYWSEEEFDNPDFGLTINWNPALHLKKIYVNPYASSWYFETVNELVKKLDVKMDIEWSNLKAEPLY